VNVNLPCYKKNFNISVKNLSQPEKYHVIYCSDPHVRVNRVACLGERLYMESPEEISLEKLNPIEEKFMEQVKKKLGLTELSFDLKNAPYPRFVENDLNETEKLEKHLETQGIFLLGRYASWRFLLTEDVWDKTKKILQKIE
jgi:hypothetical protein